MLYFLNWSSVPWFEKKKKTNKVKLQEIPHSHPTTEIFNFLCFSKNLKQANLYFSEKINYSSSFERIGNLPCLFFLYLPEKPISYNFLYLHDKVAAFHLRCVLNIRKHQSVLICKAFLYCFFYTRLALIFREIIISFMPILLLFLFFSSERLSQDFFCSLSVLSW